MDNTTPGTQPAPKKAPKKKGPIRTEAVAPFFIIVAIIALYFVLFFDHHLRKGLEWAATRGAGAEVNIGSLHTSFIHGTFDMENIEVTDAQEPAFNKFQVGRSDFAVLWDALLRGKVVITHSGITDIQVHTKRKHPGEVLPPPKESMTSKIADTLKDKISGSALGDAADLLEGMDPTQKLKEVGELKSVERVKALQGELAKKEADWNNTLKSMPSQKDFADLQARINAVSAGGGNPAEIAAKVNQVKSLISDTDTKVNAVTSVGTNLNNDIGQFNRSVSEVDNLVKQDREDLEKRLKIPSLDAKSLAMQLFGGSLMNKLQKVEHYANMARSYMPAKNAKKDTPKPAPRARGRIYEFPTTTSYPRFWLKKAEISSKGSNSAFGGDVEGEILDASSNMALVGRPAVMNLKGDFPQQSVRGVTLKLTADHRTETPVESLEARVGSFPVPLTELSNSDTLKFGFNKAAGSSVLQGSLKGDVISLSADNSFKDPEYFIAAKSELLKSTVQSVAKELTTVHVAARAEGPWNGLKLSIDSNLAQALEHGLQKQLQAKLADARKQLDAMIHAKIDGPKNALTQRFNQTKGQLTSEVDARKKQAGDIRGQAEQKLASVTRQAAPQGKALDAIKKKLPF